MIKQLDWSAVDCVSPLELDGSRIARVYCKHPTLTFDEWWVTGDGSIRYLGVNEPPPHEEVVVCNGSEHNILSERFMRRANCRRPDLRVRMTGRRRQTPSFPT